MKQYYLVLALCAAVLFVWFIAGVGSANSNTADNIASDFTPHASSTPTPAFSVNKVEVIHFHGTHQCYSCITVGDYAEETVNTYFSRELAEGRISFMHINAELPENQELAVKYSVTSASLWIGVYDENGFHKEQNTNVWYKISNKADYMSYLKGVIEKRLNGDLS